MTTEWPVTRKIVVGVDESSGAAEALRWAVAEAELHDAEVTAVLAFGFLDQHGTVVAERFDPGYGRDDALEALRSYIASALGPDRGASVRAEAVCNLPRRALLDAAGEADLLVVGARGLGGFRGLLLGSVSQHCLHHATTPIAIVGPSRPRVTDESERIVAAIDGSENARRALAWALEEGRRRKAAVEVVHACDVPSIGYYPHDGDSFGLAGYEKASRQLLKDAVAAENAEGLIGPVQEISRHGGAATVILEQANEADLLVMGSRGLGGLKRVLLGSVTTHVSHHATCPLVVIPPEKVIAQ